MQDPLQFDLVTTTLQLQRTSFDDQSSPTLDWWPHRDLPALVEMPLCKVRFAPSHARDPYACPAP